jgi:hypothetical protein
MDRSGPLSEVSDLIIGGGPVDLSSAALAGRWISMANVAAMNAILIAGIGTAGDDPVISLEQATDASGTGAKALNIKHLRYKIGSTSIDAADDVWVEETTIDRDNPAASWDSDGVAGAENVLLVNVYVLPQDLDINNDFAYIRLNVADVGTNAQLGAILYIPSDLTYKGKKNFSLLS